MGNFSIISDGPVNTTPFTATVAKTKHVDMWGQYSFYAVYFTNGMVGKMRTSRNGDAPVDVGKEYTFQKYKIGNEVMLRTVKQDKQASNGGN